MRGTEVQLIGSPLSFGFFFFFSFNSNPVFLFSFNSLPLVLVFIDIDFLFSFNSNVTFDMVILAYFNSYNRMMSDLTLYVDEIAAILCWAD